MLSALAIASSLSGQDVALIDMLEGGALSLFTMPMFLVKVINRLTANTVAHGDLAAAAVQRQ